jgi:ABC-type branched-subunit amino acid transport system substrate-binding protein
MERKKELHMKRFGTILVLLGLLSCSRESPAPPPPAQPTASANPTVRVAAVLSLTGPAARFDAVKQNALNIARDRINARGAVKIDLTFVDAGGTPETNAAAVQKALDARPQYILSGTSPNALAIAARVRDAKLPIVQIANAANPQFGPPRAGEYRFWPDWRQEASVLAELLTKEQLSRVLLIHSTDPYSEALKEALKTTQWARGASITEYPFDPAGTPDFRATLLGSRRRNTQALVVFGLPPGMKALVGQMAETGWQSAMIGGVNINLVTEDYGRAGLKGDLWSIRTEAMGATLPAGSEASAFRTEYQKRHGGETAPFHALYLCDALYFIEAAHRGTEKGDGMARAAAVRAFDGASGHIEIAPNGTLQFRMAAEKLATSAPAPQ